MFLEVTVLFILGSNNKTRNRSGSSCSRSFWILALRQLFIGVKCSLFCMDIDLSDVGCKNLCPYCTEVLGEEGNQFSVLKYFHLGDLVSVGQTRLPLLIDKIFESRSFYLFICPRLVQTSHFIDRWAMYFLDREGWRRSQTPEEGSFGKDCWLLGRWLISTLLSMSGFSEMSMLWSSLSIPDDFRQQASSWYLCASCRAHKLLQSWLWMILWRRWNVLLNHLSGASKA